LKLIIVDYGMGNLRSVAKACEHVGFSPIVSSDPDQVASSDALILPGVGAFKECVENLNKRGLFRPIQEILQKNDRPFLGICLGLQLLFTESEEGEKVPGFDVITGKVRKFVGDLKIPHMGWNQIQIKNDSALFKGIPNESYMYFVHSFYVDPEDKNVIATQTEYGQKFTSSIQKGNIYGIQCHPEKSQEVGLSVLKNFKSICESFKK